MPAEVTCFGAIVVEVSVAQATSRLAAISRTNRESREWIILMLMVGNVGIGAIVIQLRWADCQYVNIMKINYKIVNFYIVVAVHHIDGILLRINASSRFAKAARQPYVAERPSLARRAPCQRP